MIVKIPLVLAICFIYIKDVSSASFSKVFVQSGADYPVEYVQYGAPAAQLAPLTAAPVGSVVPYSSNYVAPCGTPCVYPGQVAAIAPSANIVQYQPQTLPVVVAAARNEPSAGYEYSYVVYDEQTGDHKAQRESSDGSVVRGGYSFLQPDGFVRDVQYVADDTQGFNAIVKHFMPITVEGSKKHEQTEKSEPDPCNEVKNEQLKVHESHQDEAHEDVHVHEIYHAEPSHENLVQHESHEEKHEKLEHEAEVPHEEHSHEEPSHEENPQEPINENEAHIEEAHEEVVAPHEEAHEAQGEEKETHENNPDPHESHAEEIHEEPKSDTEPEAKHTIENTNILVPYNDIIRCVQAAINGVNVAAPQKLESPLTYIILNKPC